MFENPIQSLCFEIIKKSLLRHIFLQRRMPTDMDSEPLTDDDKLFNKGVETVLFSLGWKGFDKNV